MSSENLYKKIPDTPGVYLMKNAKGVLLYVGKAANLKRRVSSYFLRPHDARIQKLVSEIRKIDYKQTDSALEALILEAELIKTLRPPYNIRDKDDKSFLFIEITKEQFPRVLLVRGKNMPGGTRFGPFTSASSVREAMKILRRIFSWSTHKPETFGKFKRPCFEYEIGLCPGTCIGAVSREEYAKTIKNLKLFFAGKKKKIIREFTKDMIAAGKKMEFEKAEQLKRRIFALQHIRDIAFISENHVEGGGAETKKVRIEGYDISNTSGTGAVGSMVVFTSEGGEFRPDKNEYRKFKIKTITGADDTGMLREVLSRRFKNDWPLPDLILVDGGAGQVHAAKRVLAEIGLKIPILGIAKGPERKRNDIIGLIPKGISRVDLVRVRDEAHRFAISYHKKVRGWEFLK